jgi:putative tryptophan/tyrosine transport system substrate-binding protein
VPVVFIDGLDPVKSGFVSSLGRPGGSATGFIAYQQLLGQKRLGLLRDLLPRAATIALLMNRNSDVGEAKDMRRAAQVLGLGISVLDAGTEGEIDAAFASLGPMKADALYVATSPFFFAHAEQIIAGAARLAIPASYFRREFAVLGGLMSYGSITEEAYRVLGDYTGRVLKGEKPGNLPIQLPTRFEFVINFKTARALGLTIPETLLATADEVIQ